MTCWKELRLKGITLRETSYLLYEAKFFGFCRNLPLTIPPSPYPRQSHGVQWKVKISLVKFYFLLSFTELGHIIAAFVEYLCLPHSSSTPFVKHLYCLPSCSFTVSLYLQSFSSLTYDLVLFFNSSTAEKGIRQNKTKI